MWHLVVEVIAFLTAVAFALVWGAHVFETAVLFRVWAAEPAKALPAFVTTPYSASLAGFWRSIVGGLYTIASIALIAAIVTGLPTHIALAIAGVCGLIHLAMIMLIFLPTNVKLGFYSGEPASLDPEVVTALVRRWGAWNFVRVGVETVGLVAAVLAFKAS